MLKDVLTTFLRNEKGQYLLEYTLLLTLIGATSLVILTASGINVGRLFHQAASLAPHAEARLDPANGR